MLVEQTGEHYPCATGESLLQGMLKLGRKGIPAGCVNGGCGVRKVRIIEGEVTGLGPVSRAHVSAEEEACGFTFGLPRSTGHGGTSARRWQIREAVFEWVRRLGVPVSTA